ncbi:MAG: prolipoprotein diacylglyceryl transferase [Epulopiscium sp. Nele67-Bin005]|nr:MAG: prolipoprotein diacylglyceryl transferase [Epulopiscium sp. Nele67-Bin005]
MPNIYFPHLNLSFNINSVAFEIFGLAIYWYGIIITTGIVGGLFMSAHMAKKEKLDPDIVFDFVLYDLIFAIIGARIYFVAFNWDYYGQNIKEIFNLRGGGIAIYGAIIASVIVASIYCKIYKINLWQLGDIAAYGLLVGQIIGRYGNFANKEAFGDYTNNVFAMCLLKSEVTAPLTQTILDNIVFEYGAEYIQVHPTFLYESMWNMLVLACLLLYYPNKKKHGEIFFLYITGYGIGRFWIEGLRTDQLILNTLNMPASQVVAILSIILGIAGYISCRKDKTFDNLIRY